ncbi:N-acetyltransferase [Halobacillus salinus]|uniref:N-acetyltransferase n=1 Tax=Halobacillus salinus TaxID=192814 RepID=A0A4Z0GX82_9BACI|nr:N-acetyltransferase [Halobacillus salinus]TGB01139.1 N-acetyltransferase [Halobacillus salinus]
MIHESAKIGNNVSFGENVVVEENVTIGDDVIIGHNVIIKEDTVIGNQVHIHDQTVLGKIPGSNRKMARKPSLHLPQLVLSDGITVGSNCVLYRGAHLKKGVFIGDLASIRENVSIGEDSIVGRNAMVENNTTVGERVTIQTGSYITADMVIEDEVFIGPCFSSSNDKYMGMGNFKLQGPIIKKGAKIGNNATLLPAIVIGENSIVGAGAVVTKDVPPQETVVGNPIQPIAKK